MQSSMTPLDVGLSFSSLSRSRGLLLVGNGHRPLDSSLKVRCTLALDAVSDPHHCKASRASAVAEISQSPVLHLQSLT